MEATKYVIDIATRNPVVVGPETIAWAAEHLAEERRVHYLLVVDSYQLQGIVCLCDLSLAPASATVATCMHRLPTTVEDQATAMEAADLMRDCHIGCLPVVDWSGGLLGIVTRHDLKRAGVLHGSELATCAVCGSTHGLPDGVSDAEGHEGHEGREGTEPLLCFRCTAAVQARAPDVLESTLSPD